jgi:hypothetical protein
VPTYARCDRACSESVTQQTRGDCCNCPVGVAGAAAVARVLFHEDSGRQPTGPDECKGDEGVVRIAAPFAARYDCSRREASRSRPSDASAPAGPVSDARVQLTARRRCACGPARAHNVTGRSGSPQVAAGLVRPVCQVDGRDGSHNVPRFEGRLPRGYSRFGDARPRPSPNREWRISGSRGSHDQEKGL